MISKKLLFVACLSLSLNCAGASLLEKQQEFSLMLANLIQYAYSEGYSITFGECHRWHTEHGHPKSLHKQRLACDLNLFKGSKYLKTYEKHLFLGLYWEYLGGSWGGRFDDPNHYSMAFGGMK